MNETNYTNHLINEKSPYLLQHAHNPVNWFPWSEEAFSKAREEDKPVFLSIGYSTCHWCHVMERESFEDEEVAKMLNDHFISIKVDREERPDIDSIYMEFCQALTGNGGWPMTVFLTSDKKPFYAGTYFPKHSIPGHTGLMELLDTVQSRWKSDKSELLNSAEEMTRIIREAIDDHQHREMEDFITEKAFNTFEMSFDRNYGGFGSEPKFPSPHNLLFLLRYGIYKNESKALDIVEKTLIQMYKGGIFDHIGYGFSRYSVDKYWLVPHFEKMLYDNALLVIVYSEAYTLTKKEIYKEIAEKIITFVTRDMTCPEGAFYTAFDADSEGEEGKFYIWTKDEIYSILSKEDADFLCDYYNVTKEGNFEHSNILNLIHHEDTKFQNIDVAHLEKLRSELYTAREKRIHPYLDDKILTSLNGMMIAALSIAGRAFNNEEYINQAEKAYEFIIHHLVKEGRLLSRYRDKESKYLGYLEDYAYFIWGIIELFLSTGKCAYIRKAMDLNVRMMDLFEDAENGGFYHTGKDAEELILKTKEIYDGAIPSGNSVVTMNLIRLSEITDDIGLERLSNEQFNYFASKISESPNGHSYILSAYILSKVSRRKIVFVANKNSKDLKDILNILNQRYLPFTTTITLYKEDIENENELFPGYRHFTEDIAAFICENYQCNDPLFEKNEILSALEKME